MESVEETTTQAAVEKQDESLSQTITRVTKKRVKDSVKVAAGALGAKVRNHNLRQRLLSDLQAEDLRNRLLK